MRPVCRSGLLCPFCTDRALAKGYTGRAAQSISDRKWRGKSSVFECFRVRARNTCLFSCVLLVYSEKSSKQASLSSSHPNPERDRPNLVSLPLLRVVYRPESHNPVRPRAPYCIFLYVFTVTLDSICVTCQASKSRMTGNHPSLTRLKATIQSAQPEQPNLSYNVF